MPLLKGSLSCRLQVALQGLHLVSSECKETQVFRPFSGKESGATISVTQSMSLVTISESTIKNPKSEYRSFFMNHSLDVESMKVPKEVIRNLAYFLPFVFFS